MTRRAAILLEIMLAVALFGSAAAVLFGTLEQGLATLTRSREEQRAADLACSAMALLEAGLARAETLAGPGENVWAAAGGDEDAPFDDAPPPSLDLDALELDIETQPAAYDGLTEVRITVRRGPGEDAANVFELWQLVRLTDAEDDEFAPADRALEEAGAFDARPADPPPEAAP